MLHLTSIPSSIIENKNFFFANQMVHNLMPLRRSQILEYLLSDAKIFLPKLFMI